MKILSNPEYEKSIIATAMYSWGRCADLFDILPDDFYHEGNKDVFAAIRAIDASGEAIGMMTVHSYLIRMRGENFADEFMKEYAGERGLYSHEIPAVVAHLKDLAIRRRLRDACMDTIQKVENESAEAEDVLFSHESDIRKINDRKSNKELSYGCDGLGWDRFINTKIIETGFAPLDEIIGGFKAGQLIILGARTSIGKTAFALQVAHTVSQKHHVLLFPLEDTFQEVELRLICHTARIEYQKIEKDLMSDEERRRFIKCEEKLVSSNLKIIADAYTLEDIVYHSRRAYSAKKLGFIIVDYLQLAKVSGIRDRHLQVAEMSRTLKLMAKQLECPILALSQLNRIAAHEEPDKHHLRESGAIEQDANIIIFLWEPKDNDGILNGCTELIVGKNKMGPIGKREVGFNKPHQFFFKVE